ncbi:MAG: hypothetical protein KBA05_01825 [Anaerolineaceae bacterium]|nr:hypothetical protein [Anaerolineaceae bacterium]MDI9531135.1 hypothetical protein [Chloroflexota bacterium]HOF28091.1 hypothetical protein [Anaerolineaceae bacterium]
MQAGPNALGEVRDELLPCFNQHQALTFLKERTEVYQAGLPNVAEEKREALSAYYADVAAYVQESRQQMNFSQNPVIPGFPQLDTCLNQKGAIGDEELMNGYPLIRPQSVIEGHCHAHSGELEAGKATNEQSFDASNCALVQKTANPFELGYLLLGSNHGR